MKLNHHDVLVKPLLTEKITNMRDQKNCVSFVVSNRATRIEIWQAVEAVLKVKVESVNVMNVKGKPKRQGRFIGKRADWKKAIVTLKEGEKVELYESA